MKPWSLAQLGLTLALGLIVWAALACAALTVGSTGIGWPSPEQFGYRLEPVLLASLIGAALATAGVAYQAILRNPLAEPYLLGVSSGASLCSYLWRLLPAGAFALPLVRGLSQQAFAFAGAALAVAVVFTLATRRGRLEPITLLLVGVIVNAVNGSVYLLVNAIHRGLGDTGEYTFLVGGIQTSLQTSQMVTAGVFVGAGWLVLMALSGELNVATLSTAEAESLGVRIHRLRWIALIVASIVTASGVSISGPIGFVGLVCPHLGRMIVGPDVRRLLPVATALGAGLLALADAASRWLSHESLAGTVLPVGVLTGLLGGPFFLFLLYRTRRDTSREEAGP